MQGSNKCPVCGEQFVDHSGTGTTLVGYFSPPGHDHDDNCKGRVYRCPNGHYTKVFKRAICPACDWKGKQTCWCHEGEKWDEWPALRKKDETTP